MGPNRGPVPANTNLGSVRRVKESEFPEGFMRRRVGAVRDRGAGALALVLGVRSLRGASVEPGRLPRGGRAVGESEAARGPQVGRRAQALLVPELHVVVAPGLGHRAAAALQPLPGGAPSRRHRRVDLGEAGLPPGAVVDIVQELVLPVAGREL